MGQKKQAKRIGSGKTALLMAAVLLLGLMSACGKSAAGVVLVGSTSVQPYAEVLAEEYHVLVPDSRVDVQGGGSATGIEAAETGTADIGMSSRNLTDAEESKLWSIEIAKDGIAIVVNPANPVTDLTLDQVRDIYAANITDWSEVGGHQGKIHLVTREEGSGTRSSFESLVMGKAEITPKAIVQASNGAVRQVVSSDPDAVGFISLGLVDETVKAIQLDDVMPTRDNILNGSYSLYRPFLFVCGAPPEGPTKEFIDFVMSAEGQRVLEDAGLITAVETPMKNP
ncbi:MAG: phosphate ABC transporter substrate-binding protein [Firmicutes bacterium]|nr:phosphate ABC transporter substrate-binding protein [Bacillota bacterium]